MIRESVFEGHAGCVEISNGFSSVIVSTGFGPRVLSYALDGGNNILGWHPDAAVETKLGTWKPYGGHRLWLAPEDMPLSYSPDNDPVECVENDDLSVTLVQKADPLAVIEKQMTVALDPEGAGLTIDHRITNVSDEPRSIAAWALTIMRPGGVAIVPNEPAQAYGGDTLLPVRSMALWSYTDFTDPRWRFEKDEVRLCVDETLGHPQKIGVLNKQGWAAYEFDNLRFTKRFDFMDGATYPDMNSNTEIYTAGGFVEVETLSPLTRLAPNGAVDHRETWSLSQVLP